MNRPCPSGESVFVNPKLGAIVQSSDQSNLFPFFKINAYHPRIPPRLRGVRPIVTRRGARDAMDAGVSFDEDTSADGEKRVVLALLGWG